MHLIIPITKAYKFNTSSTTVLQKPTKQNVKLAILSEPRAIRVRSIPKTLSLVVLIQGNNLQYSSEMGRDKSIRLSLHVKGAHYEDKICNAQDTSQHKQTTYKLSSAVNNGCCLWPNVYICDVTSMQIPTHQLVVNVMNAMCTYMHACSSQQTGSYLTLSLAAHCPSRFQRPSFTLCCAVRCTR